MKTKLIKLGSSEPKLDPRFHTRDTSFQIMDANLPKLGTHPALEASLTKLDARLQELVGIQSKWKFDSLQTFPTKPTTFGNRTSKPPREAAIHSDNIGFVAGNDWHHNVIAIFR